MVYLYIYVTGTKTGSEMKQRHFILSVKTVNWHGCWWGMQTTIGSLSVHVQWFSHQNDGADYCDIIK